MGLLYFLAFVAVYFFPSYIANLRDHRSFAGIFVLNIFLGWTFIFWVLALVWAYSGENEAKLKIAHGKRPRTPASRQRTQSLEWRPEETRREYEKRIAQAD